MLACASLMCLLACRLAPPVALFQVHASMLECDLSTAAPETVSVVMTLTPAPNLSLPKVSRGCLGCLALSAGSCDVDQAVWSVEPGRVAAGCDILLLAAVKAVRSTSYCATCPANVFQHTPLPKANPGFQAWPPARKGEALQSRRVTVTVAALEDGRTALLTQYPHCVIPPLLVRRADDKLLQGGPITSLRLTLISLHSLWTQPCIASLLLLSQPIIACQYMSFQLTRVLLTASALVVFSCERFVAHLLQHPILSCCPITVKLLTGKRHTHPTNDRRWIAADIT